MSKNILRRITLVRELISVGDSLSYLDNLLILQAHVLPDCRLFLKYMLANQAPF